MKNEHDDVGLILRTIAFAAEKHLNQPRKDAEESGEQAAW